MSASAECTSQYQYRTLIAVQAHHIACLLCQGANFVSHLWLQEHHHVIALPPLLPTHPPPSPPAPCHNTRTHFILFYFCGIHNRNQSLLNDRTQSLTWWHQLPELALGVGPVSQECCCLGAACLVCMLLDETLELLLTSWGDHTLNGHNLSVDLGTRRGVRGVPRKE